MHKITTTLFLVLFASLPLWSQGIQFTKHSLTLSPTLLRDIKATDMDGDGDQDALVTGGGQVVWYRNADGKGTFDSVAIVISADVFNLNAGYAADLDGDGDQDVLVGTGSTAANSEVAWFKNMNGFGTVFSTKITLTTLGDEFRDLIAADFDGDLDMDIVYGSYGSDHVRWMRNTDGAGTFSAPITLYNAANGIRFIAVADSDGDTDLDFFTSSFFSVSQGQFSHFRNSDGMGNFDRQNVNFLDGQNAAGIAAGDVDGDGDADLVGCLYNSDVVFWYNNDGTGNFGPKITLSTAFDGPFSIVLTDLDSDSDNDLIVAAEGGNKLSYLLNNGLGVFSTPDTVSTSLSFANVLFSASRLVAAADIDSDGDVDILATSTGQKLAWFEQNKPLVLVYQTLNPLCNGSSDGAIFIQAAGGVAPYTYTWNDALLQGDSLFGLSAGMYALTLTDLTGSQFVQNFTLSEPAIIEINTLSTPSFENQNDGTASSSVLGGVAPYTYQWDNGATTASIFNLSPGPYAITVTDANGCTQTDSILVEQIILPLSFTSQIKNPSCNDFADGAILIALSGGLPPYNFQWNSVDIQGDSVYGLSAGSYLLTITDNIGNQIEQTFTLTAPAEIILTMNSTPTVINQNNGTASVLASGGIGTYTYFWTNGATSALLSNLASGIYSVTVTDANGCTKTNSVVIEELVSTGEPGLLSSISIWPNPANDHLFLDLNKVIYELKQIDLLNANSQLLHRLEIPDLQSLTTLNWGNENTGGYILLVFYGQNGSIHTEKIMVR